MNETKKSRSYSENVVTSRGFNHILIYLKYINSTVTDYGQRIQWQFENIIIVYKALISLFN